MEQEAILPSTPQFDLTPDTRVLEMLGQINLPQWRCLAELIDNGVDGFLHAIRADKPIEHPQITISLPQSDDESARIIIKDNGPGMSIDTLEHAMKAGWSGNNATSSLGLFGMGFNIATARLGYVTEVWTTQKGDPEAVGVRIDLEELRTSKTFKVPRRTRPKADPQDHGTEIVITKLKPEQRAFFARSGNVRTIKKHLAKTYSALLALNEVGRFRLLVNNTRIEARRHCIWSDERIVELPEIGTVRAVETFNFELAPRHVCMTCMLTLPIGESTCPVGGDSCTVESIPRRVRGWIGLQRYLDETEYGIDILRNGRKIEIANKDLFSWSDGEKSEVEYPIDDPRHRGRLVGEVHIDHCRVSYTKDRFERDDPSWGEMIRVIRGEGPLRPQVARKLGYQGNGSPLYKLYQAFRRSSPQGKNGLWSRVLVVKDNDRARQMADAFANGEAEYLGDERWWQLVEEQDKEVLGTPDGGEGGDIPPGFTDPEEPTPTPGTADPEPAPSPNPPATPVRVALHELTRAYIHPTYRVEFEVQAFHVQPTDPKLPPGSPWVLYLDDVATRTYAFLMNPEHEVFRSTTMTAVDALLIELTHRTLEFLKGQIPDNSLASVLADFRSAYAGESRLDSKEIIARANAVLDDISRAVVSLMEPLTGQEAFDELEPQEREFVTRRMMHRGVADPAASIKDGRFWEHVEPHSLMSFFSRHPDRLLDGRYWDDPYFSAEFSSPALTMEARNRVITRYQSYLDDAIWLARQNAPELDRVDRDRLIRAVSSLRLLRPDVET